MLNRGGQGLRQRCAATLLHSLWDALVIACDHAIYALDDYTASRRLGDEMQARQLPGIRYRSVRAPGDTCWGLLTPRPVEDVIQTEHYEMIWNGAVTSVNRISAV
nr:RES family NAD+ phosphorylase [Kushneria aurantia]